MKLVFDREQFYGKFLWDCNFSNWRAEIPFLNTTIEYKAPVPFLILFGTVAAYLLCIYIVFPMLKPRSIKTIQTIGFYHHTALCIYSFFIFSSVLYYMYSNGDFSNYEQFLCTPISGWLRILSISFAISKIWEWLDTAIFLWRGKTLQDIGFLHIYHHTTTTLLFLVVMNSPGTERLGMLMNGFVHTLMYFHYAFRYVKYLLFIFILVYLFYKYISHSLPKPLRPLITVFQIIQLIIATYYWFVIGEVCPSCVEHKLQHPIEYIIPYACVPVYCLFFIRFFFQEYIFKKASPKVLEQKKNR